VSWYRSGVDVAAGMGLLATYLGHVNPVDTYWYLSASPELIELMAARLEGRSGGGER
jgi:integrase/recombinase XerD